MFRTARSNHQILTGIAKSLHHYNPLKGTKIRWNSTTTEPLPSSSGPIASLIKDTQERVFTPPSVTPNEISELKDRAFTHLIGTTLVITGISFTTYRFFQWYLNQLEEESRNSSTQRTVLVVDREGVHQKEPTKTPQPQQTAEQAQNEFWNRPRPLAPKPYPIKPSTEHPPGLVLVPSSIIKPPQTTPTVNEEIAKLESERKDQVKIMLVEMRQQMEREAQEKERNSSSPSDPIKPVSSSDSLPFVDTPHFAPPLPVDPPGTSAPTSAPPSPAPSSEHPNTIHLHSDQDDVATIVVESPQQINTITITSDALENLIEMLDFEDSFANLKQNYQEKIKSMKENHRRDLEEYQSEVNQLSADLRNIRDQLLQNSSLFHKKELELHKIARQMSRDLYATNEILKKTRKDWKSDRMRFELALVQERFKRNVERGLPFDEEMHRIAACVRGDELLSAVVSRVPENSMKTGVKTREELRKRFLEMASNRPSIRHPIEPSTHLGEEMVSQDGMPVEKTESSLDDASKDSIRDVVVIEIVETPLASLTSETPLQDGLEASHALHADLDADVDVVIESPLADLSTPSPLASDSALPDPSASDVPITPQDVFVIVIEEDITHLSLEQEEERIKREPSDPERDAWLHDAHDLRLIEQVIKVIDSEIELLNREDIHSST